MVALQLIKLPDLDPPQVPLDPDSARSASIDPERVDDPARLFPPDGAVLVLELFQFEVERRDGRRERDERRVLRFQGRHERGGREGMRRRREERGDLLLGARVGELAKGTLSILSLITRRGDHRIKKALARLTSIVERYRFTRSFISSAFLLKYSYGKLPAFNLASWCFGLCGPALYPSINKVVLVKSFRDCSSSARRVERRRASVCKAEVTVEASCARGKSDPFIFFARRQLRRERREGLVVRVRERTAEYCSYNR